jgi:predicted ATPase
MMGEGTPRLRRLKVEGLKSLRSVEVTFPDGPTVLIGPNGSGKSNLLEAIRMLAFLRSGSLRRFVAESGGASAILHYGPQVTREVVIELEFERHNQHGVLVRNGYRARLGYAAGDTLIFLDEEAGYAPSADSGMVWGSLGAGHTESRVADAEEDTTARVVSWLLHGINFYHFHDTSPTSPLRQNARVEDDRFLHSYGMNLPAYLFAMKESEDRSAWRRIHALIRRICPFIKYLSPTLTDGDRFVRLGACREKGKDRRRLRKRRRRRFGLRQSCVV